jgi:hypothetical protein
MVEDLKLDVSSLADPGLNLTGSHITGLLETITGAGAFEINMPQGGSRVVLFNPKQVEGFKCQGRLLLQVDAQGTLLSENLRPVEIDYFGLIQKIM